MKTYKLVSIPIDHFPIVLYDKDFHCTDGNRFHITDKTLIVGASFSKWKGASSIEFNTFQGFMVLSTPRAVKFEPISAVFIVTNDPVPGYMATYVIDW